MSTEKTSRKGIGGPKTQEGKERVRLNALKMGLHANSIEGMQAVGDAMGVSFQGIHDKMLAYYHPNDPIEETLVRRIARCTWKLQVIEVIEDHKLNWTTLKDSPTGYMECLSVMERRTDIQLHRAIAALLAKRNAEYENVKNELREHRRRMETQPPWAFRDLTQADLNGNPETRESRKCERQTPPAGVPAVAQDSRFPSANPSSRADRNGGSRKCRTTAVRQEESS